MTRNTQSSLAAYNTSTDTRIDEDSQDVDAQRVDVPITDRMRRGLCEQLLVCPDVGWAANAPGLVVVYSETGHPYRVDVVSGQCDCRDQQYNTNGPCKHVHRARFATGRVPLPAGVDIRSIDSKLGVNGDPDHPAFPYPSRSGCE